MLRQTTSRKLAGFTLIELLVVIAIIAILATLIAVKLTGAQGKAHDSKAKSDVSNLSQSIIRFSTNDTTDGYLITNPIGIHGDTLHSPKTVNDHLQDLFTGTLSSDPAHYSYDTTLNTTTGSGYTYDYLLTPTALTPTGTRKLAPSSSATFSVCTTITQDSDYPWFCDQNNALTSSSYDPAAFYQYSFRIQSNESNTNPKPVFILTTIFPDSSTLILPTGLAIDGGNAWSTNEPYPLTAGYLTTQVTLAPTSIISTNSMYTLVSGGSVTIPVSPWTASVAVILNPVLTGP